MSRAATNTRLVAETLADAGPATEDAAAKTALNTARQTPGDLEAKILAYFTALPGAGEAAAAVGRLKRLLFALGGAAVLIAFLGGAATARTAFDAENDTIVNFFWVLGSLLGLNTLMLLVWLVMLAVIPREAGENGLGALVLWLWRKTTERFIRAEPGLSASAALATRLGAARRWVIAALSHAVWTGFLLGALVMTLLLLSTQQYVFVWETTILSAETYTALTNALAALPALLGMAVPESAMIAAAQWREAGAPPATDQPTWSAFLVACIGLYGLAPRLVALAATATLARRRGWRRPLDLTRPAFARLIPALAPVVQSTAVLGGENGRAHRGSQAAPRHDLPAPPAGTVAVLGWEIDQRHVPWPPADHRAQDLGIVDGATALAEATARIREIEDLARLVVVADLCETPDRGVTAGLKRLHAAAGERAALLLTGAAPLRQRLSSGEAADRLADWVSAAHEAGFPLAAIVEIDLSGNGEARRRLDTLLGAAA